jgi:hypothetical protein
MQPKRSLPHSQELSTGLYPKPNHPRSYRPRCVSKIHFNIIHQQLFGLLSGLLPSGFPTNDLFAFIVSFIRATCPTHHILLHSHSNYAWRTVQATRYVFFSTLIPAIYIYIANYSANGECSESLGLQFRTVDKVQKAIDSECFTPPSDPFRICNKGRYISVSAPSSFLQGVMQFVMGFNLESPSGTGKVHFTFSQEWTLSRRSEAVRCAQVSGVSEERQHTSASIRCSLVTAAVRTRYLRRDVQYCRRMMTEAYIEGESFCPIPRQAEPGRAAALCMRAVSVGLQGLVALNMNFTLFWDSGP